MNCGVEEDFWESPGLQGNETQSILKEINPECSLKGLLQKKKKRTVAEAPILWPPDGKSQLIRKDPDAGKDWMQKEKRAAEDEMIR